MSGPDDQSTLTIKFGKDFDSPWAVFYGNPSTQRRQLLEAFGAEDDPDRSLIELAAKFAVDAQAVYALAKSGATQTTSASRSPRRTAAKKAEPEPEKPLSYGTDSPPAEEPAEVDDPVLKAIEAASDRVELKRIWAENQDAFATNKAWQAAYRDKTKTLGK